jgi:uncharacterized protein (DUF433 family)
LRCALTGALSIPFIGLAEGMFLSALRRAGMSLQQVWRALELVQTKLGVAHALASRRLFVVGARLVWDVGNDGELDTDTRHGARDLIVLKDGQHVFRQVIQQYLTRISHDDEYADRVGLPNYEVAELVVDPTINFGKPYIAHTGTPLAVVRDMLRAGEAIDAVADDLDLSVDEVTEVAHRDGLLAA